MVEGCELKKKRNLIKIIKIRFIKIRTQLTYNQPFTKTSTTVMLNPSVSCALLKPSKKTYGPSLKTRSITANSKQSCMQTGAHPAYFKEGGGGVLKETLKKT